MEYLKLLQELSDAFGPPGGEEPVARLVMEHLKAGTEIVRDRLGSVLAEKAGNGAGPRLMLAAHMDEIGFMVQAVTPQGYVRLQALGGWPPSLIPGQRLVIAGAQGPVPGVVAAVPMHFRGKEPKEPKVEELFVDLGAGSPEEVARMGVGIGDLIVPKGDFTILNGGRYLNKAWDDRVGVAALIAVMQNLKEQEHPATVIAAATVQEEVGVRGATAAVELVRPDAAIVLEGPPADDYPGLTSDPPQGALGRGVQIRLFDPSIIVPRAFWQWAVEVARGRGIAHQLAVRRSGSTDARVIHLAQGGIPTLVLGVPVRYAHGPAGIIVREDFDAMVALTTALAAEMTTAKLAALGLG